MNIYETITIIWWFWIKHIHTDNNELQTNLIHLTSKYAESIYFNLVYWDSLSSPHRIPRDQRDLRQQTRLKSTVGNRVYIPVWEQLATDQTDSWQVVPRQVFTPYDYSLISVAFIALSRVGCLWVTGVLSLSLSLSGIFFKSLCFDMPYAFVAICNEAQSRYSKCTIAWGKFRTSTCNEITLRWHKIHCTLVTLR